MAHNPDPAVELTTIAGVTRTLDDWTTVFHLCLVVLPGRPEAARYVSPGRHLLDVFRGADCKTAFLIVGNERQGRRVLGAAAPQYLVFLDSDGLFVKSLGLARLPALVHIAADTTLVAAAEGWHPAEWTAVARGLAQAMSWTHPVFGGRGDPSPFDGWTA